MSLIVSLLTVQGAVGRGAGGSVRPQRVPVESTGTRVATAEAGLTAEGQCGSRPRARAFQGGSPLHSRPC